MRFDQILNSVVNHNGSVLMQEGEKLVKHSSSTISNWMRNVAHLFYANDHESKKIQSGLLLIEDAFMQALEDYALASNLESKKLATKSIGAMNKMPSTLYNSGNVKEAEQAHQLLLRMNKSLALVEKIVSQRFLFTNKETLQKLDSSVIDVRKGTDKRDALPYLANKLLLYSVTHSHRLTMFQKELLKALIYQMEELSKSPSFMGDSIPLDVQGQNDLSLYMDAKLTKLDGMQDTDARVGILFDGGYRFINPNGSMGGHFAPSGCRKENGLYIVTAYNAGSGALGKYQRIQKGHIEGKTLVEFKPMTREEVKAFLINTSMAYYEMEETPKSAIEKYKKAFKDEKIIELPLPSRDFQRIDNCALRNVIEWVIYTMQRAGEEKLANDLVFFNIIQDETTHPKKPIVSANLDEGFFHI